MLVLTRKLGEGVAIGDQIRVVVIEIRGNHVRLGIQAPREMAVHREEVLEKIVSENKLASGFSPDQMQKAMHGVGLKDQASQEKRGSLL